MADDIVPGLLEKIQKEFDEQVKKSPKIKESLKQLKGKKATYKNANEFSIELGEILAKVLEKNISGDVLPDGRMYFNIGQRILNEFLGNNYKLISGYSGDVQTLLNKQAKIGLKTQVPPINQDRIDGLVNRLDSELIFENVKWLLEEPVINFSQNIVDDFVETNANFHAKSGLSPKLTRTVHGKTCEWCKNLAGTYDYPAPSNIYQRHERCRCIVEYNPKDGRGVQNSHTKKWLSENRKKQM